MISDAAISEHHRALCLQHGLRWVQHHFCDGRPSVLVMRAEDAAVAVGQDLSQALERLGAIATPAQIRERKVAELRAELQRLEKSQ